MEQKKIVEDVLKSLYKNAHVALQSLSNITPETDDLELKNELLAEYEAYEKIIGELSSYMAELKIEPKDINPLKKAMMWSSIKMSTMVDNGKNHIADMMLQGTNMGVIELTTIKNESEHLIDDRTKKLLNDLLELEEKNIDKLKTFL